MDKTTRQTINDLYVLAKVADREEAERINEIIDRLQSVDEHDDEHTDIYVKLSLQ